MYFGGEFIQDIFLRVSVFIYERCREDFCISFLSLLDTLSFVHRFCDHLVTANIVFILDIYIYIYDVIITFHLSLHVLFLFSLYTQVSYFMYAILYFYFTLRCLDEFCLKYFRNTGCQNLSCHELSSYKVFQEFVLGLDFILFNK